MDLYIKKIYSCLLKSKGTEYRLKTRAELKLFERKLDFWNLFENWNFENYLKIGALEIKFERN